MGKVQVVKPSRTWDVYVVADASVFIWGKRPEGELISPPAIEAELKDLGSRSRFHIFGARAEAPSSHALKAARLAAEETGDAAVLSPADLEALALALEHDAALATDDYALQNVALHLGLNIEPVGQPAIKRKLRRVRKCRACGRVLEGNACPDCGTPAMNKKRCIR